MSFTCIDVLRAAGQSQGSRKGSELWFTAPYREDKHPSLRVNVQKDVWVDDPVGRGGNAWSLAAAIAGCDPADKRAVLKWLSEHGLNNGNGTHGKKQIVAVYPHHDASGKHVYDVVRYEPKDFRPRQLDGTLSLPSDQCVLYRLPEVLAVEYIFFCEGQKDVDNLRSVGLTATTSGSATSWQNRFADDLRGKHVTILPHNDAPGRRYAQQVAASLSGKAASVKVLELAGLPADGGDVSNWLQAGKDADDAAEELSRLAENTPAWTPSPATLLELEPAGEGFPLDLVIPAAKLLMMPIPEREDIVSGLLHIPALGMLVGPRGAGKTRLAMSLVDAITRAQNWLAWSIPVPRRALFFDGELPAVDLRAIVRDVCGPEPSPLLDVISSEYFYRHEQTAFTLNSVEHQRRFLLMLEALESARRRPDVIVFDNLSAMSYGTDENSNSEQDSLLRFLMELRHKRFTALLLHHTGRNNESRGATRKEDPLDLIIKLDVDETVPRHSARFTLKFSKMRRKMPTPAAIECELLPGEDGRLVWGWSTADREPETWVQCLRLVQNSKSQDDIARILDVNKSTVSRHLKVARDKKLLDGMTLTASGRRYLDTIYGGEM